MAKPTERCLKRQDPSECLPEQIRECHGEGDGHPCEATGCEQDATPSECTPEQIRECHGDAAEHPCETGA